MRVLGAMTIGRSGYRRVGAQDWLVVERGMLQARVQFSTGPEGGMQL